MGSFWLLLSLRRRQIQTLISMSTLMPRIAKEENLLKLGEEFWPQTPAETMDTGHPSPPLWLRRLPLPPAPNKMPLTLHATLPPNLQTPYLRLLNVPMPAPNGTEDWTRTRRLQIIAEM